MKVLIIEDEQLTAGNLELMIRQYDHNIRIIDKLRSVEAAINWLRKKPEIDLLFLDIHLLDGTCFDILKETSIPCPVIFTTAYDDYALEAFRLHSIDYLLKPVNFLKLKKALDKFKQMQTTFHQGHQSAVVDQLLAAVETKKPSHKSRVLVKSGSRIFSIDTNKAAYFFSQDKITHLVTLDDKKYSINHTLEELEAQLDPQQFFRINRQMIVHIQSIQVVHSYFKGRLKVDLLPDPSAKVMVSSRRVSDFKEWLDR